MVCNWRSFLLRPRFVPFYVDEIQPRHLKSLPTPELFGADSPEAHTCTQVAQY